MSFRTVSHALHISQKMISVVLTVSTNTVIPSKKAMLAVTNHLGVFRRNFSMILLDTEVRLTDLWFPRSSLSPFSKVRVMFTLSQEGISPDCHNFSNMMGRGFVLPWTVPSGPTVVSHQVPRTCAPSVSLHGVRVDLLQWVVLNSSCLCLCILQLKCDWYNCQ